MCVRISSHGIRSSASKTISKSLRIPTATTWTIFKFEMNARGTVWDLFLARAYRDTVNPDNGWDIKGLKTGIKVDGTLNDPSDTDRGWVTEIAIPWSDLRSFAHMSCPPQENDQWRVNFLRGGSMSRRSSVRDTRRMERSRRTTPHGRLTIQKAFTTRSASAALSSSRRSHSGRRRLSPTDRCRHGSIDGHPDCPEEVRKRRTVVYASSFEELGSRARNA